MGLSPRVVTEDRLIAWDGVSQRLPKGQVMDVPPDSPLERAIGAEFLVPLPGTVAQVPEAAAVPAGEPAVAEKPQEPAPAPKGAAAAAKKQDSAKDSTDGKGSAS